jgi:transglutaminase-like putative cysteine protease
VSETAVRRLRVTHTTRFTYDRPIEHSSHKLRLCPMNDWDQRVLAHTLTLHPDVPTVDYEDVFGNWVTQLELTQPYTALTLTADSTIELYDGDPFAFAQRLVRPTFPLQWMPWEQIMVEPYRRVIELPDTQLAELFAYAMTFVEQNHHDLLETLFAINLTLFREYRYAPGSTTLATTPYDVFRSREGVCQDFSNLFICLARLLGVPARYVCGYLYTGNVGEHRARSDATHAWVQLYLPGTGWKGFDPTNGVLPGLNHVRVAYGRHFRDATSTSGTLYTAANESMAIEVTVTDVS